MVSRFLLVVLCRYFVLLRATTFPGCTPVSSVFHIEAGDNLFSSVNLLDDTEIVGNLNWIYAFVAHFWLPKSKFRMSSSHASPPAIRWKTLSKCGTVLLWKLFCILQKWSPAKSSSKRSPVSCIVSKSFFMLKRQCCWPTRSGTHLRLACHSSVKRWFRIEGKWKKGKRKKGTWKKGKRNKGNIYSVGKKGNGKLGNPVNFRVYIHAMNRMKKKF